ncbi:MAG TPA: TIR domain-containing protein [Caulobacteraceae bacterium]|jgi:adenylate cyclase
MADVFISYAHSTAKQALGAAAALRALGYTVWLDDDLKSHRAYTIAIEEQLVSAKAVLVIWSADAARSEWVLSEANRAREDHKLVQLVIDKTRLPMPFDQVQCANLAGWPGDGEHPNWRRVVATIAELVGGAGPATAAPTQEAPPLPSKPSIAVMPFANLSSDPEQEYFADGMVEEIVAALSRIKSIFVIGSGSTHALKGKTDTPQEVAGKLGVHYVLEGSVRKAGERVRIAVQLTDAEGGGTQIWAERFEDTLEDVFALQDKVALSVAAVIEPTVQSAEVRRAARRPTESMGAYDLYLRALPLVLGYAHAENAKALPLLDRALSLDPDFGPALVVAAECYNQRVQFGWSNDPEGDRRRAVDLAQRAVRVSADDAEVLARAATPLARLEGLDAGAPLIRRAMALNPGSSYVRRAACLNHVFLGEPDLALRELEVAARMDPLTSDVGANLRLLMGIARFQQGRFADALPLLHEAMRQTNQPGAPAFLAATCGHLGRIGEAQAALARYRAASLTPIETRAIGKTEHRKLFVDGIALAEERAPAADS